MSDHPDIASDGFEKPEVVIKPQDFQLAHIRPVQQTQAPPCGANCPSGGNVREWIGLVAQRDKLGMTNTEAYRRAWETIVDRNPFPATMGRICPHPCEAECNRIEKDGAVAVNELERFLGDWGITQGLSLRILDNETKRESIAVVGAGPAGLSFAYQMARRGYPVTVFDRNKVPGGMLRFGIPDYRLPPAVLDAEIQRITDLGVELKLGQAIGDDISIEELRNQFDVLFIGVGAQIGRRLGVPGEEGPSVWSGTEYLHRINTGQAVDVGNDVIVVGGGNTAIDAARAARRQGATVTILYRRTRAEMPAIEHEIDEALEEDVTIEYLSTPTEIRRENETLRSVVVQRMKLGQPDESGRRRPLPVDGDTFNVQASTVLVAISQEPDWASIEELNPTGGWMQTAEDGLYDRQVFGGGDVRGLGIASMAIGHGRSAAEAAHVRLQGHNVHSDVSSPNVSKGVTQVKTDLYAEKTRTKADRTSVEDRLHNPTLEISQSVSESQFLEEASRCLSCESCFGCQSCWMYCNAGGFVEIEDPSPGNYFKLDLSVCEGCGKCIDVCPSGFLIPQPQA